MSAPKNRLIPKAKPAPLSQAGSQASPGPASTTSETPVPPSLLRSSPSGPVDSVLAAIVIALIGFLSTVAYATYVERGDPQ